ncbi:MAG: class I SAM-dependent methyltransferase [Planctomycetes bacterium]|nr:class I SAM-dependent methyltransferase [Planctomycetota bacterium]
MRDAREDWRRFDAGRIPSKAATPYLDRFLAEIQSTGPADRPLTLLDVGCGSGAIARRLYDQGFSVLGVDVNPEAITAARHLAVPAAASGRGLRFEEADFAAQHSPRIEGTPFDVAVCQLVLSIIGDARHRANLLRNVWQCLRPGGWLSLSASGVSDTINAGYARLYADDIHLTGERHTYVSRDDAGTVLYVTHHFTPDELVNLLEAAGFREISLTTEKESSSRRPAEAAYFHYVTCRRPSSTPST